MAKWTLVAEGRRSQVVAEEEAVPLVEVDVVDVVVMESGVHLALIINKHPWKAASSSTNSQCSLRIRLTMPADDAGVAKLMQYAI